jgi:23S rRNA (cytidine2498-2'-O)-methyltransferase
MNDVVSYAIGNCKDLQLVIMCRPGLENDAAAEIMDRLAETGLLGYCKAKEGDGWLTFHSHGGENLQDVLRNVDFYSLIFVRQWFVSGPTLIDVDPTNRIEPILAALERFPAVSELVMETLDTNDGKELGRLGNSLHKPLFPKIKKLKKNSIWRAHVLLISGTHFVVGVSTMDNSAAWPGGIPRLRFLREAPSRSALKLEEAMYWFFNKEDWPKIFKPTDRAIDLGAAPGGWTWQLTQRGMNVTAIDNGAMNADLLSGGFVKHIRGDAFTYEPTRVMSWMVCDIVDKPARVAELIERWFIKNFCQRSIFNLKLPMKHRYRESKLLLDNIRERCAKNGVVLNLRAKQLYHDREEITVYAELMQAEIGVGAEIPAAKNQSASSAKSPSAGRSEWEPKSASRSQAREKPALNTKSKMVERAKAAANKFKTLDKAKAVDKAKPSTKPSTNLGAKSEFKPRSKPGIESESRSAAPEKVKPTSGRKPDTRSAKKSTVAAKPASRSAAGAKNKAAAKRGSSKGGERRR